MSFEAAVLKYDRMQRVIRYLIKDDYTSPQSAGRVSFIF